jgi:DNA-binding transcriptional LysR family regulator
MELRQLRYFIAIANLRNFTRAADHLGIAQPPLSRQIKQLEDEVGFVLIDRNERPLVLTEAGRLFYERALHVLASLEQLEGAMKRLAGSGRRRFVIGFVGSAIYGPMPRLIRHFRAAVPAVDVNLIEMTTLEQMSALKDGRIDIGIGRLRIDDPAIRRELVLEEEVVAALPAAHPLAASSGTVSLADLAPESLIVYPRAPRPSYADQVLSLFRDHGHEPSHVSEVRDLQATIGMVAAEAGVSVVPISVQRLQREDIVYRRLTEANAASPILMSWREVDQSAEVELIRSLSQELFSAERPADARAGL